MGLKKLKNIVVSGADGALGGAVCQRLQAEYPEAQIVALFRAQGAEGAQGVSASSRVRRVGIDLANAQAVDELFREIQQDADSVDALLHCAGGFRYAPLDATTDEDFDFLLRGNFLSTYLLLRRVLPVMKKQNYGRIVCVSARSSLSGGSGVAAYTATKAAVNALVQSVTQETLDYNITVNAVLPTIIDTPANRAAMPDSDFSKWVPLSSLASTMTQFLKAEMDSVRGALLPVSGRL